MPIRMEVRVRGVNEALRYLARVDQRLNRRDDALVKAVNAVAKVWDRNFQTEGSMVGGWASLSEYTKQKRAEQGFDSGPILIRYGSLRAVVTEGFAEADRPGIWGRSDNYSNQSTVARLSIRGDTATLEAHGWKVANQWGHANVNHGPNPPRPFWFVTRPVMAAAKEAVSFWILDEVLRK